MKRGILFPPCGFQYVGMGKELYDEYRTVQEYFEEAIECSSINFIKLCFAASEVDMSSWEQGPFALLLVEFLSSGLLRHDGVHYDVVVGWDMVSWYGAVHAARAITLPDGLYIIRKWTESFQGLAEERGYGTVTIDGSRASTDAMVMTLCGQASERGFLLGVIVVSPTDIVVGGDSAGLLYIEEILQREEISFKHHDGITCTGVALPEDRAAQVQQYLEKIDFIEPQCPVIDPHTGDMLETAEQLRSCARDLIVRPIRQDRMVRALQQVPEILCSIPSARFLTALKTIVPPSAQLWTMETKADYEALRQAWGMVAAAEGNN
jgi:[acyl-carrier-protein] S-malonyltransferase